MMTLYFSPIQLGTFFNVIIHSVEEGRKNVLASLPDGSANWYSPRKTGWLEGAARELKCKIETDPQCDLWEFILQIFSHMRTKTWASKH